MTLALHLSGLPFVAGIVLGLLAVYGLLVLMGDDDDDNPWLR